ncbi:ABC transporter ATP-binding protein [Streptomyces sp. NPDC005900]|uniref:ABC transporter ATP-binding protein n=1 Tax=Streptomyces sp. NPDC005900 TaxID=3154569 RepID=UPI0033FDC75B
MNARFDEVRAVVDRLGRYTDSDITWGGDPLADMKLAEVRRRILFADNDTYLFGGSVRSAISVRECHSDEDITRAVRATVDEDIFESLPDGLESRLHDRALNVSGGQRQQLRLVRALLAGPEVLLLVEPTWALDAHTEATVAARVNAAREGRLMVSTSPLLLGHASQVVVPGGRSGRLDGHAR